jgi:hypothetical protein
MTVSPCKTATDEKSSAIRWSYACMANLLHPFAMQA